MLESSTAGMVKQFFIAILLEWFEFNGRYCCCFCSCRDGETTAAANSSQRSNLESIKKFALMSDFTA